MSLITIKCSECGNQTEVDTKLCGQTTLCANCSNKLIIPAFSLESGTTIGGFQLEKKIGIGGMGEVWLAHQTVMSRRVALKILSPRFNEDTHFINRFLKEVENSAKLEHPNIVTAFDAGEENNVHYLAVSYVEGTDLGKRLKNDKVLPEKEALRIIKAIAEALRYAWEECKILHRDLKPENIMIDTKGIPKLMDMGISKNLTEDISLTETGVMLGSPYYISPEQAMGKKNDDCRSDIYSLGATLFHLVTGSVPFEGGTVMEVIAKHVNDSLPDPRDTNPRVSEPCCRLIEMMMAKKKEERQSNWTQVIEDVDAVLNGQFPLEQDERTEQLAGDTVASGTPSFPFGNSGESKPSQEDVHNSTDKKKRDAQPLDNSASLFTPAILLAIIAILAFLVLIVYMISSNTFMEEQNPNGSPSIPTTRPTGTENVTTEEPREISNLLTLSQDLSTDTGKSTVPVKPDRPADTKTGTKGTEGDGSNGQKPLGIGPLKDF